MNKTFLIVLGLCCYGCAGEGTNLGAPDGGSAWPPVDPETPCTPAAWSCQQISSCADSCGTDLDCINGCKAKGCAASQAAFEANMQCIISKCLSSCSSGSSSGCDACVGASCAPEMATCSAASCPGSTNCSPAPGSDGGTAKKDTGAKPPTTPGACLNCAGINQCAEACGTNMSCIDSTCKPKACSEAQTAFDSVTSCIMSKCLSACMSGYSQSCEQCIGSSCKKESDACETNQCPATATCGGGGTAPPAPTADNCMAISQCAEDAGLMGMLGGLMGGGDPCLDKGCASAKKTYQALSSCVEDSCIFDCIMEEDGADDCATCVTKHCQSQLQACQKNQC